jgi:hypothetical protein
MSEPTEKKHGCLFYGCVGGIGLVLLFVGGGVALYFYGIRTITPVVETYLTHIDGGDYQGAYALVSSEWKKTATLQQFTDFEKSMRGTLGACQSKALTGVFIQSHNTSATARVSYNAQFANGPATLTFTLAKENGQWLVQGLVYNSDLLSKATTCPHCGTANKTPGNFCSNCGKPLRAPAERETPAEAPLPPAAK